MWVGLKIELDWINVWVFYRNNQSTWLRRLEMGGDVNFLARNGRQ